MPTYVFVPVSDELLFDFPERIRGPLVPYSAASVVRSADSKRPGEIEISGAATRESGIPGNKNDEHAR